MQLEETDHEKAEKLDNRWQLHYTPYLVICCIELLDATGHVQCDIPIGVVTLGESVRKHTLLFTVGVDILHCVIRKVDLLGAIRVMLLALFARDGNTETYYYSRLHIHIAQWSLKQAYFGNSTTSSPSG